MSKNLITDLASANLRSDVPAFRADDTIKVHVKVVEGNRSRVQIFQGVVISRQGGGLRETFKIRKISFGVGVERTYPLHSPIIDRIGVRVEYWTETVTRMKSPLSHGLVAVEVIVTSEIDAQAIVTELGMRFGMRRCWVAIAASVSALFPSVQLDVSQGWTAVTRAISRAAWLAPFIM